jgi:hypothetical protein
MRKETIVTEFKVLSQDSPGETEENYINPLKLNGKAIPVTGREGT